MRIILIVNPKAGAGKNRVALADRAVRFFPEGEAERVVPGSPGEAREIARKAVEAGTELVVAAGGDGTIHDVACELIGSKTVLGVLPLGSGNGLAHSLGIGISIPRALEILKEGEDRAIDVGEMNGEPFFSFTGIGFDAVVGEEFQRSPVRGPLPYFGIAARESLQYRPVEVTLRFEDREVISRVFMVTVANVSQFGVGARIAPKADPSDGLLDVVVIRHLNVFEMLVHAPKLFDGSLNRSPRLETYRSRRFRIIRSQSGPMHTDGEPVRAGHVLDYRVRPGALRVRVPPSDT